MMLQFLHNIDVMQITKMIGYSGLALIIFCETGLFLGFFLPGDSLLFSAGLLATQGYFNVVWLIVLLFVAAVAGYGLAYWMGNRLGHWLLKRPDNFWYKKRYLEEAHVFYEKHGGKALIIGRLMPIVRTFLPIAAGMAEMSYVKYSIYNLIGALIWCGGLTLLGYFLGNSVPNIDHYLIPIIFLIAFISVAPTLWHIVRIKLKPKSIPPQNE